MPHGYCYLWDPGLVWIHVVSDALIALAYFAIPAILLWFVRKRRDLPFGWMFLLFGVFIIACGSTHALEIWNLWHASYWLSGVIKAVTAAASIPTAILLAQLVPRAVELPSLRQWMQANAALEREVRERRDLELTLRASEAAYREQAELLDLAHDAIIVRNLENEIVFWNRAAERLYGWSKEEVHRRIINELLRTRFPKPLPEIEAEINEGGYWEGELVDYRRDGSEIIVSSRWALRRDSSGRPSAILQTNRDISPRRREEQKFRSLLESAPDAIVIVDHSGRIQLVNAQTANLFGYSREELLGQPVEILVPQRFRAQHERVRAEYSQEPRALRAPGLDLWGCRKDGTEFPVEINLSPLELGQEVAISSTIRDVTEQRRAAEALKDSEERLQLALDSAQLGAWDLDLVRDTAVRSLRHDQIFGYSSLQPEWGAAIFLTHVLPEDRDSVQAQFAEAFRTGSFSMECRILWPDHSVRWISAQGRVYRNNQGDPARMLGVVADISDRKRWEEALVQHRGELARSNIQLAAANKELEAFSYSVSHDLRAPLRHIDGFARILREDHAGGLSKDGRFYIDRILQAVTHMGRLVDDLLNLSRIGRKEMVRQKAKLDDLVREVLADLRPEIAGRNIEWRIGPLPEVECDRGLLKLVFSNLLSNAAKFTRTRQPAVIEIGTREAGGAPAFFVRDNGVGFDPRYADKLFGVFQRLHRQEDFEGTGVGLATVQRIIDRHGGKTWAESEPDRGTTFFFTLRPEPEHTGPSGARGDRLGRV